MALTPQHLSDLNARIGWLLDKHLAPIFKPGTQLTFIARTPGNDEADVLVTTERDINDVVALALRSLSRHAVGKGVDVVPRAADAQMRYDGLHDYAQRNKLDYNELCRVVRDAAGVPVMKTSGENHE